MIFLSFFKTLEGKTVTVELKNDLQITGTLASVDQFLNFKLANARAVDSAKFPQLLSVKDMFVRGSVIRYVSVPVSVRVGRLRARTALTGARSTAPRSLPAPAGRRRRHGAAAGRRAARGDGGGQGGRGGRRVGAAIDAGARRLKARALGKLPPPLTRQTLPRHPPRRAPLRRRRRGSGAATPTSTPSA